MRKTFLRSRMSSAFIAICVSSFIVLAQCESINEMNCSGRRTLNEPLIFVGGVPRSGTTLLRAILDAHPDIRCGEETHVIPRILEMHRQLRSKEKERLGHAHINQTILSHALGAYILTIITEHGPAARRLCNKDPLTLRDIPLLIAAFPNAKFILMIRDGRATVHSIFARKVTISGFDTRSYEGALEDWNMAVSTMFNYCLEVGPQICYMLRYEELVLSPRETITSLLDWLNVPWNEAVLHHEDFIGKEVTLSIREVSTSQVYQSINAKALTKWKKAFSLISVEEVDKIAPMLRHLGYDPSDVDPSYANLLEIKQAAVEMPPDRTEARFKI